MSALAALAYATATLPDGTVFRYTPAETADMFAGLPSADSAALLSGETLIIPTVGVIVKWDLVNP